MRLVLAFALATVAPVAAMAAPVITLTTPGSEFTGLIATLGFEFSVKTAGQAITSLGVYDSDANGLSSNARIGLWDLSGTLLTSTTILAGTGTLDNLFRFQAITPYALTAGTHYVVGAYTPEAVTSLGAGQGGSGSISSQITIYRDRYALAATLTNPTMSSNYAGGARLGANFVLTPVSNPVPEPAAWAMMIAGFGMIGASMRARRRTVAFTAA